MENFIQKEENETRRVINQMKITLTAIQYKGAKNHPLALNLRRIVCNAEYDGGR
jgi:hypothetical protein